MTTADIISLVSSLGFPICACIALGYYIVKKMDKLTECIDNNTKAIMLLAHQVKGNEDDQA